MSTIIIITPPPKQQNLEQLEKDAQVLRDAGFEVTIVEHKKEK